MFVWKCLYILLNNVKILCSILAKSDMEQRVIMNGHFDLDDTYTYDLYKWLVVSSEARAQQLRPVNPSA